MFRLDGKIALVTGAARGLGAATARLLAAQGARVALADLDGEEVARVATELGSEARSYQVDVSDLAQLRSLVATVVRDFGGLDILVNNAGICPRLSFAESTEEDWDRLMAVNARSQFFLMQAVCAVMKQAGGGRIINVASVAGRVGAAANASIYSGAKGAVVTLTRSIAREVAGDGILVNCIAPGMIDTDLMRNLPPERVRALCEQVPLKRLARPEEIAACILFLASDECSYATGATFDVNGGWVML